MGEVVKGRKEPDDTLSRGICAHIKKAKDAEKTYSLILAYYVTSIAEDALKKKANDMYCKVCEEVYKNRLHACLECAFFGCFVSKNGRTSHMREHYEQTKHYFAVDVNHGNIFCFICNDYIYNEEFEEILEEFQLEARRVDGNKFYMTWRPKAEEIALIKDKLRKISPYSYIGLRGIVNIGNSCYVNCVLQVFIHTPVMRDFMLGDKHMCFLTEPCLTCEMFVLFQEFYSGMAAPYNPSDRFFETLQKHSRNTLGKNQECAHEFYQEVLTGLHSTIQKSSKEENCKCLIHKTYYGHESKLKKCSQCNALSCMTPDSFTDIVIDSTRSSRSAKSKKVSIENVLEANYLQNDLLCYFKCETCQQVDTTYMRTAITKLPTVLCFRVNCFQNTPRRVSRKSNAVEFKEWLKMSPYLDSKANETSNKIEVSDPLALENRFRLFAVIFHKGDGKGGHYAVYIRQQYNRWFECSDSFFYERNLEDVLKCDPFLIFYHKVS